MTWLTIQLFYLIGYRNRLLLLINSARYYLFREHTAWRILPLEPPTPGAAAVRAPGHRGSWGGGEKGAPQ
jgi:hypothetical protein